ncbi:MAG: NAD(P)H-binding protein [Bacteroidetes bacterium]|nr:NAD(P)H-binding protein [Bacteroidota bacterium]
MKVAIIGATGFVGSKLVDEALARGLIVTAISRDTSKITDDRVSKVSVDVTDVDKLTEVLKGHDTVISAFNAGWKNPNIYDDFIVGAKAIQNAVKNAGINRLIVVGGAGSLYVSEDTQLIDTPDFPEDIKPGALAARDYFNLLKEEKDLNWAFFSPAIEMHPGIATGKTGNYRLGKTTPVFDANIVSRMSVEDVAVVLLDETENPKHHQEQFTAAY